MWLNFIKSDSKEDVDMLKQINDPIMNKAVRAIIDMSAEAQIRVNACRSENALHDEAFYMEGARAEGRAEGIAEVIAKLKANGMSDSEIEELLRE